MPPWHSLPAEQCRAIEASLTPVEQSTQETIRGVKSALHLVNNVYSKPFFIVTSFQTNQPTVANPSRLWHVSTLESDTRHSLGKTSSETHECLQGPKDTHIHCAEAPSNDSLAVWIFHPFIKIMTCSTQGWNGPPSIVNPVQESEMGQKLSAFLLYCLGH